MNFKIREAKIEDIDSLKMTEQELIRYEHPFAPDLKNDSFKYFDLINLLGEKMHA